MAGYWPSFCFFFLHFYEQRQSQGPYKHKKRVRLISSHHDQTSLVNKGFIIWPKDYTVEFHFCGNKAGNPEWG